jgi:hypothetical protein
MTNELEDLNDDDINAIEAKVISRLQKKVIVSKKLSEKQQSHIDSLATKRTGKKYNVTPKVEVVEVAEPEIIKPKKVKKVIAIVPEESSEEESEVTEVPIKKAKKKAIVKPVVKPKRVVKKVVKETVVEPVQRVYSNFRNSIF